jgi:hypothetical protein
LMRDPPGHDSRLCVLLAPVHLHICAASKPVRAVPTAADRAIR